MIELNYGELAALEKRLKEVSDEIAKKATRSGARKGMNKVRKAARTAAQDTKDTGLMDANFGLMTRVDGADVVAKVGIRGGGKENLDTPFYFRFVELGTKTAPAKPFLQPALENNGQDVLETVVTEINRALDKV